jgi:nitrite reductase/ring-hydroxylating ferredoxin subunit
MTVDHEPHDDARPGGETHDLSRRGVLRGTAVGALALPVLAACGSDSGAGGDAGSGGTGSSGGPDGGSGGSAGETLAPTGDVPVDGGTVLPDQQVVLTQPSDGDFKAFTAVCTHQGCIVASVSDGTINCDCHGSKFSIEDGSVVNGPATAPLEAVPITVENGSIDRA